MWLHTIKNNIFMLKYALKFAKFNVFQRIIYSIFSVVPSLVNVLLVKALVDSIIGGCNWQTLLIIVSIGCVASIATSLINSYIINVGNKKSEFNNTAKYARKSYEKISEYRYD